MFETLETASTIVTTSLSDNALLSQTLQTIKQTEPDYAQALLKTLVDAALVGTLQWDINLSHSIQMAISRLDQALSRQLADIMHTDTFLKLEGTWRGLQHLVMNTETSTSLRLKVLNLAKQDLVKDLSRAAEFDQSLLFKKIYEHEFGMPGGEPYAALLGDYEFDNQPNDVETLSKLASMSAAAFCPFITAASPQLFGFSTWTELDKPRDLEKIFDNVEYAKWQSLRGQADSRFINLTMPRVLARLPYGAQTQPISAFCYEEIITSADNELLPLPHQYYCWSNAAYAVGVNLSQAFAKYNWCTAIRGAEGGGRIENLPLHQFKSLNGDMQVVCPTEVSITDRREAELSRLGLLPLCHYKNTDYAVIFGAQSLQKPLQYDKYAATANAAIAARLPYLMATSRFAHYLKIMARDKMGSFMAAPELELWLNDWLQNYVNANQDAGQEMKAKYPLAAARVQVEAIPGKPGAYRAVAWLRPWLQLEELTAALRLVANIPQLQ